MIDRQLLIFDVSSSSSILNLCFSFQCSLQEHALGNCCGRQAPSQPLLSCFSRSQAWWQNTGMWSKRNLHVNIQLLFLLHTFLSGKELATNMAVFLPVNRKFGEILSAGCLLSSVLEWRGNQEIVNNVGKSSELPLITTSTRFKWLRPRPGTEVGAQLLMKALSRSGRLWKISVLEVDLWIKDGLY